MYKIKFENAEAVPAELKEAMGDNLEITLVPKAQLDTLREGNVELSKKMESIGKLEKTLGPALTEFETPEEFMAAYKELTDLKQKVADGKLKASDSVTQEVERRTQEMQQRFQDDIKERESQLSKLKETVEIKDKAIKDNVLISHVREVMAIKDLGLNPTAEKAIIAEAREQFTVKDDGSIAAVDAQGNTVWGPTGNESLTMKQWAEGTLKERSPYLYQASQGADVTGDAGKSGHNISSEQMNSLSVEDLWQMAAK